MRTIIFRGFSNNPYTGWVQGDLIHLIDGTPIIRHDMRTMTVKGVERIVWQENKVVKKSIGQFTGIKDGNGTEIFEGDIIEVTLRHNNTIVSTYNAIVDQKEGAFGFKNKQGFCPFYGQIHENYKVIGNIHDNPELMKGGDQ